MCKCSADDAHRANHDDTAPESLPPDLNLLQTRLHTAVAAEDYSQADALKRRIAEVLDGSDSPPAAGWQDLGVLPWLAQRAEGLGFRLPTDIQRRAARPLALGADIVVQAQTGSGKTLAFLMPVLSMLDYPPQLFPDDLKGPQAVIVVPHRDLGVQITLLVYKLLGGNISSGIPGDGGNMFSFTGPRGLMVRGCLDKEEVLRAKNARYFKGCHVVVGTPDCLAECLQEPSAMDVMSHAKAVVVDEADECLAKFQDQLDAVLTSACSRSMEERPSMVFVGATLDAALLRDVADRGWLSYPVHVESVASASVPSAVLHRYVVVPDAVSSAVALAKLARRDLAAEGADAPRPRALVFAASQDEAVNLAEPLRSALWEEHRIGLLVPAGEQTTATLHDFRDFKTSMLLMTPAATRGLDLPADVLKLRKMLRGLGLDALEVSFDELRAGASLDSYPSLDGDAGDHPDGNALTRRLDAARKALEDLFHLY